MSDSLFNKLQPNEKANFECLRPHVCTEAKLLIRNNAAASERLQPPQMVDWPCRFANLILRADMSIYLRRRNTELYMYELNCGPVIQQLWHLNVYALYGRFYMCFQEEFLHTVTCVYDLHICLKRLAWKHDWNANRKQLNFMFDLIFALYMKLSSLPATFNGISLPCIYGMCGHNHINKCALCRKQHSTRKECSCGKTNEQLAMNLELKKTF